MQLLKLSNAIISKSYHKLLLAIPMLFLNCNTQKEQGLVGTWELISAKTITKDSVFSSVRVNERMIKILNESHFSFLRHDTNKGKDSTAVYVAGGGRYSYKNGVYIEYLDYLNFREWEGKVFEFKASVKNDTLTITGTEEVEELGVNHQIIEVYKKL